MLNIVPLKTFQLEHKEIPCIFNMFFPQMIYIYSSNLEVHSSVTKRAREMCFFC